MKWLADNQEKSTSVGSDTGNAVFGTRSTTSIHQRSANAYAKTLQGVVNLLGLWRNGVKALGDAA